jgi:glycosyltransferase involved in cell wall biosynthesis
VSTPVFSILTPIYNPPAPVLEAMLRSVRQQTFGRWEHCVVDDCSTAPHVREILARAQRADRRLRVRYRQTNGGIVAASNDALAMARGEFVALLDHDDELVPEALRTVHKVVVDRRDVDYIYSDEERIDDAGRWLGTFAKPGWSPERLRTQMYVLHLSVMRRALVQEVGGFDPAFDGSQDWDLILKVTERARQVVHVPEVLYRWRAISGSTALEGIEAKPWAFAAGTRAIQAHCDRIGLPARASADEAMAGIYHLEPQLRSEPPVSIVIPTAGQVRDVWGELKLLVTHCVESVVTTSTYGNYELVIVVDDQVDPSVVDKLRELAGERLRVVHAERPFNFSDRINAGVLAAGGDHLLLLNDDMEVITPNWVERLVMYSSLPGVGAVGAKLLFGDGRIQHVGVVFDHTAPGHLYRGFRRDYNGYFCDVLVANNYLAVTGACLMVGRELFEEVGGFSTLLPLNYNDIDFCLKLRAAGQRVAWDPDTVLYHFESSSRETAVARWEHELLMGRWEPVVRDDPFYHGERLLPAGDTVPAPARAGAAGAAG